ncbi:hypothetical protein GCM10027024_27720 [Microbacterium insulae]
MGVIARARGPRLRVWCRTEGLNSGAVKPVRLQHARPMGHRATEIGTSRKTIVCSTQRAVVRDGITDSPGR